MMVQNIPEKKKRTSGRVRAAMFWMAKRVVAWRRLLDRPRAHAYTIYLYKRRRARGASPAVGPLSYISGTSACRGPSAAAAAIMQIGINHFIRS